MLGVWGGCRILNVGVLVFGLGVVYFMLIWWLGGCSIFYVYY